MVKGSEASWRLAELNIARANADMDSEEMAEFVAALERINALAESSPGFVWRLKDESGDATSIRAFDDPLLLVNMSVWESVDALFAYVYRSAHAEFLARRKEWFAMPEQAHMVLWWTPGDAPPSLDEAKARLEHLRAHGPTVQAFTFKQRYDPPSGGAIPGAAE